MQHPHDGPNSAKQHICRWGDQANIELSISAITSHVEACKAKEMQLWKGCFHEADEVEYKHMLDACLYFIPPHRFTEIDARFIHELSSKVSCYCPSIRQNCALGVYLLSGELPA